MDKEEKLRMLQKFDEKLLTKKVIIPLYESEGMGCKNVQYAHKTLEFGKDIIYYKDDEHGNRVYTAIQVKATKITAGKGRAIVSQIQEAFGEPFTDLGDGKKKEIGKVVLLTSHEFTGGAKDSMRAALKGGNLDKLVTFVDGNKLVSLLDGHLPSAFWEEYDYFNKYFHAMKEDFETIKDISAIGQKEAIPLEKIYVSLRLSERLRRELEVKEREMADKKVLEEEYRVIEEERRREQILGVDAVINKFNKVVIVGGPGSGKTTLLKHLTLKTCKGNLETQERTVVPIFITLRQYLESGKSIREYINDIFERYKFPKAKEFIEADLKAGKCQLYLDGFDELASKERQHEVTEEIETFVHTYPKNHIIVTSRIAGYNNELKGFDKLELMPFDDHQITQFITNWFGETDPGKAKSMREAVKANESIRELARNPLMIAIIAIIYEEDRQLPQRRVKLYERCVDVLLSKWDVQKKIKNKYEAETKQKILRKLALKAHIQQKKSFTKGELLEEFIEYLPQVRIEKEEAEDVLTEIVQRNVLLKEVSIDIYEFLHLSFQEYLAALELREKRDYDTLLTHLYESWWEEVVLLFAGFDRDATELLQKIKEKQREDEQFKEDMFYRNLTLVGKCIVDADHTSIQLRNEIVNDLWFLYQNAEFFSLREKVMRIISLIRPDSIIDSLIEELRNEEDTIQSRAAEALGEIGSEKAVEPLINILEDEDSYIRKSATIALEEIGSEKAVEPLIKALTDEDSYVRRSIAITLGRIGGEKAVEPLIKALTDEDSYVREGATYGLGETRSEKAVEPLIKALTDDDHEIRWRAAEALGKMRSEKAVDLLIEALTDENRYIRGSIARALGETRSEKAVEPLIKALTDENRYIREGATYGLGETRSEKAVEPLIKALTDDDHEVRWRAAVALGKIGSEKAVEPLIKALKDEDSSVQGSIAVALGEIGSEKAVPPLIEALKDEGSSVRERAAVALGEIGSEKAVPPLIEALTDEGDYVRRRAAVALGEIGSEKAVPPLIEALKDEDSDVRERAAVALGEIGSEKAVNPLKKALKDYRVKDQAFDSLEKISRSLKST